MPSDFWLEMSDENEFDWDDVEGIDLIRGDSDWEILIETAEGDLVSFEFSDEEMEDYFWDDLYYWAEQEGIDVDKEIAYSDSE